MHIFGEIPFVKPQIYIYILILCPCLLMSFLFASLRNGRVQRSFATIVVVAV